MMDFRALAWKFTTPRPELRSFDIRAAQCL